MRDHNRDQGPSWRRSWGWLAALCALSLPLVAATCNQGPTDDLGDALGDKEHGLGAEGVVKPGDVIAAPVVCEGGQVSPDTIHCCWPGQRWEAEGCLGAPQCPGGLLPHEAECLEIDGDDASLARACDEGVKAACQLRLDTLTGRCEGGELASCEALGGLYAEVERPWADPARALELFERACLGGLVEPCVAALGLIGAGEVARERAMAEVACKGRVEQGCVRLLGAIAARCAEGKDCDFKAARPLLDRFAASRPELVAQHLQTLCVGWVAIEGSLEGDHPCAALTAFALTPRSPWPEALPPVEELLSVACAGVIAPPDEYPEMADPAACVHLGERLEASAADAQTLGRAANLFRRTCALDIPQACTRLGVLYKDGRGATRNEQRAVRLFQQSCDGGVWEACAHLAWMMERGLGIRKDPEGAGDLYERACGANEPVACHYLGLSLLPTQERRALKLLKKACEAGHKPSCGKH